MELPSFAYVEREGRAGDFSGEKPGSGLSIFSEFNHEAVGLASRLAISIADLRGNRPSPVKLSLGHTGRGNEWKLLTELAVEFTLNWCESSHDNLGGGASARGAAVV